MAFDKIREALFSSVQDKQNFSKQASKLQGSEEKDLVSFVKGKLEDVRQFSTRIANEGIWLTNTAYLIGFSDVSYDTSIGRFRPVNSAFPYPRKSRLTSNVILPRTRA